MEDDLSVSGLFNASFPTCDFNSSLVDFNKTNGRGYLRFCMFETSPPLELLMLQVVQCYVNPCISIVGFGANMMSLAILKRSGLGKPSNILLFGLVISDSMMQLMTMNYADILINFGPDMEYPLMCGWQYTEGVNYFLLVSNILFEFFSTWGQYVNTTIPMIITLERFLAVYKPMTFKKIVTVKTATVSVVLSFLIWLPWSLYLMTTGEVSVQMSKVMFYYTSAIDINQHDPFNIFYFYVSDILSSWVSISFVVLGCVLIALKVRRTLEERKNLTAKHDKLKWSKKTTVTLLTTCIVFTITHIIYSVINFFILDTIDAANNLMIQLMNASLLVNASSNFFTGCAALFVADLWSKGLLGIWSDGMELTPPQAQKNCLL